MTRQNPTWSESREPFTAAATAAATLLEELEIPTIDAAVILGSGWKEAALSLGGITADVPTTSLPGFIAPTVPGHEGHIYLTDIAGRRVALLSGRVHLYEGHSPATVAHAVRTCVLAGARQVVLTNAAGSIDPDVLPGSVVTISDHLNLTGASPLEGTPPPPDYASRFVDLSDLYSTRLRQLAHEAVPGLPEGVYACLRGPHYETPAEIAMLGRMGASLVGMSTVLEAIAAHHLGAEVLGFSLVTNLAAGVSDSALNHAEVLDIGEAAGPALATLLRSVLPLLRPPATEPAHIR